MSVMSDQMHFFFNQYAIFYSFLKPKYESLIPIVTEVRVLGDADVDVQDAELQMLSNLGIKVLPDEGKDRS